jgi:hypothetical protein
MGSEEWGGAWWDWGFIGIGVKVKESLGNMVIVKEEVGGGMGCGVILPLVLEWVVCGFGGVVVDGGCHPWRDIGGEGFCW